MSESVLICPKCSGKMALGSVKDRSDSDGYSSFWVRNKPIEDPMAVFNIGDPMEEFLIGTLRCESCGYLESYARREFSQLSPNE